MPSRDENGGNAKTVTDASAFIAPLYMASSSLGSSHSSFTCVLKHRYGDFVVREVDPDGQIASLTPQEASEDAAVHAACNAEREWEEETKNVRWKGANAFVLKWDVGPGSDATFLAIACASCAAISKFLFIIICIFVTIQVWFFFIIIIIIFILFTSL